MIKKLRYLCEAAIAYALFGVFKLLPLDIASAVGATLARIISPNLSANKTARRNLALIMPDMGAVEHGMIIRDMWDNIGRVIAEYPHLKTIGQSRTDISQGRAILQDLVQHNKNAVIIGAHMANWEICASVMAAQLDEDIAITYRAPNNPFIDRLISRSRSLGGRITGFPKHRDSGRKILSALKSGQSLGILIDQKYNEGIASPFLGQPAMTNPVFAQLAQKLNLPIIPIQSIRKPGGRVEFDLRVHAPIPTHHKDGAPRALEDIVNDANSLVGTWVQDTPHHWIWSHKRWSSDALKATPKEKKNDNDT
jgi:KDO2-lipid IV(A) lauroyltransferase